MLAVIRLILTDGGCTNCCCFCISKPWLFVFCLVGEWLSKSDKARERSLSASLSQVATITRQYRSPLCLISAAAKMSERPLVRELMADFPLCSVAQDASSSDTRQKLMQDISMSLHLFSACGSGKRLDAYKTVLPAARGPSPQHSASKASSRETDVGLDFIQGEPCVCFCVWANLRYVYQSKPQKQRGLES